MTDVVIGVDLGGTRLRAARLDPLLQILERKEILTHAEEGLKPTLQRIKDIIRQVFPTNGTVQGIGLSVPGPANPFTGVIVSPPNLPGWHNVPLVQILQDEFAVPVYLGNDANVAALAEVARGAAQGTRHAIYITVSTGIGGGVIIDGKMLLGRDGLAAEVGHMIITTEDGHISSLEKEAAGPALARKARARIERGERSVIKSMVHGDLDKIDGKVVGDAAKSGDPLALDVVRRGGFIVGLGITSLLHVFNPEIVVVGGGVSTLGDLLFAPMKEAIHRYALDPSYYENLALASAGLGEDVSIIGSAALAITRGGQSDIGEVLARLSAG